jgi:hypothetical protein
VTSRRWIAVGAVLTAAGLVVAGTAPAVGTAPAATISRQQDLGGLGVLAGWAALAWGIHRFGREGAEGPERPG